MKSVVGSGVDTGSLDLKDIGGHRAFRGDAHVAMYDGERQVTAFWFHRRTHTSTCGFERRARESVSENGRTDWLLKPCWQ